MTAAMKSKGIWGEEGGRRQASAAAKREACMQAVFSKFQKIIYIYNRPLVDRCLDVLTVFVQRKARNDRNA